MSFDFELLTEKALKRGSERRESIRNALGSQSLDFYKNAGFSQKDLERIFLACKNGSHFSKVIRHFSALNSWNAFVKRIDSMGGTLEEWVNCIPILEYEETLKEKSFENILGYISCCQEYKNTHSLSLELTELLKSFLKQ